LTVFPHANVGKLAKSEPPQSGQCGHFSPEENKKDGGGGAAQHAAA
jgi:hypothetical protein